MESEVVQMVVGGFVAAGVAGKVWSVVLAWLRAFERAADQKWVEHPHRDDDDADDEDRVRRAVDSWQAEGSRVPRVMLERQVRRSRGSGPPPPNESPPG